MISHNQYPKFRVSTLSIAGVLSLLLLLFPLSLFSQDSSPASSDFDGSGTVDTLDFLLFVNAFGSKEGEEKYDAKYDLDGNGEIGVGDFLIFVDSFGQTVNSDNEGSTSGGSSGGSSGSSSGGSGGSSGSSGSSSGSGGSGGSSGGSSGDSGGTSPRQDNPPTPPSGQQQVIPQVAISAGTTPVTEGTAATFTITASSAPTTAITVSVSVTENGDVISGTPSSSVTINANETTATLTVNTVDDQSDESNSVVTAEVQSGTGYTVGSSSSASVTVEDNENPTPAKRVEISTHVLLLDALGSTVTVTVKVLDANGDEDEDASWSYIATPYGPSLGFSVEKVDGGLEITSTESVGLGRVDISSDGAKTATFNVRVGQTPASLELSPSSKSLTVDGTVSLSATIKDANGNNMQLPIDLVVYWETSDATVATVAGVDADEDGNTGSTATVTAVAAGSATITGRWDGRISGTATITVTDN